VSAWWAWEDVLPVFVLATTGVKNREREYYTMCGLFSRVEMERRNCDF